LAIDAAFAHCANKLHQTYNFNMATPIKPSFPCFSMHLQARPKVRQRLKNIFKSGTIDGKIALSRFIDTKINMLKKMAIGLVVGSVTAAAFSQSVTNIQANPEGGAYLQDSRGVIVRGGTGQCWRTGPWTPSDSVAGCDGELVPPIAKPIAPAIAPQAPAIAQTPAAPAAPQRCDFSVTLANDETFGFNKAALTNAARKRIDAEVLPRLASCTQVEIVLITGHTDRLGSHQYNQKLSEKRAALVADYLKSKGTGAQIDVLGAGKTQSVKACSDKQPRARLVECLAPNRRVVIEARGLAK
jgi:OOP family OmpA-OmpF porin